MLDKTETLDTIVQHWLTRFESALAQSDDASLKLLFHPDSHWRDMLALTWRFTTLDGRDAILPELKAHAGQVHPSAFSIDTRRAAPHTVTRVGTQSIEAIFKFETAQGR